MTFRNQVVVPEDLLDKTVENMIVGDHGWAVPWALQADENSNLWIRATARIDTYPGGAVEMKVIKAEDGFEVVIPSYFKLTRESMRRDVKYYRVVDIKTHDKNFFGTYNVGK